MGWKGMQQDAFMESSKNIRHNNLIVKVMEDNMLSKTIGEGEISIVSLLKSGYHHELTLEMALCMLQSEHMLPAARTGQTGRRVSTTGRTKRSSILYQEVPEEIKDKLTAEHFKRDQGLEINDQEREQIMADSLIDEDLLVGYQIELLSKSTGKSKGIWVIVGVRKYRFSSTSYEMKNQNGDL